ncbi:hypothetical protein ACI79J_15255 [Geodermatophilus sp. SYSU D01062]
MLQPSVPGKPPIRSARHRRPGAVAAACRAAGVPRVPLADWHRLSAATRAAMVDWLDRHGPRQAP